MQQDFFWTDAQLQSAVEGKRLNPQAGTRRFCEVVTDSREVTQKSLFIAICGQRFDAHHFLQQVVDAQAAVILISQEEAWQTLADELQEDQQPAVILVADTRLALAAFARWHRQQMPLKKLIAITGSNGKTSNKTLLAEIFSKAGKTLATQGNLNNDFGVPRTLLQLRPEDEYAIIEMGANHPGEIRYLTEIAKPDMTLITNAAGAHLEGFGSLQGVIDTKGEIVEGLDPREGVAIFNHDSAGLEDWLKKCSALGIGKVGLFARASQETVTLPNVTFGEVATHNHGIEFVLTAELADGSRFSDSVRMPVLGEHHAANAAACTLLALWAGVAWDAVKAAIEAYGGVPGRLQKTQIRCGYLLDDSYNANPESIKAGLSALMTLPGCHIACIGAMGELGDYSVQAHQEVAEYAAHIGLDALLVYGEAAQDMPRIFAANIHASPRIPQIFSAAFLEHDSLSRSLNELVNKWFVEDEVCPQINILVKGSRSSRMETIACAVQQSWG
ncbi:UDP-N-acetylmuramoyl-tripeptide--D-alanyl-D-alanine ligase [Thiomicrorhabdus sp. 6S3-12]|uniref:UDP-N-acetylmuramoyl-tripeptide--D-alanyl-D- alanine ligase n=1 Tax=Thiomicrorhabdus sp. 6S3-12 TaxID=2819681 RepID=UPI001AAD142D|nr:UDP-N-acetylmuramoyl-tripeptide--D-alanyl-D-alanine ligase [Thiomicrorhabdus sp. 6S3-12]MBO1923673.1 UDP-N-acetylmuramoyl-tripeptide--D-alanyl-D-alanine ligase [Thiomicrorhabdus sp. 6S3-12]